MKLRLHENQPDIWHVRRLTPADSEAYQELRVQGFIRQPLDFRVAPEDETDLSRDAIADRIRGTFVAGGFDAEGLAGIAGLTRLSGMKLRHKALLWGMYVHERARGRGLANELMRVLMNEASALGVAQVILTVMADNIRAQRLYQRWGFEVYGVEPRSVSIAGRYFDEALMIRYSK
jgi:ribosomal protein S18 acetylase RimI-like enzyme